MSDQFTFDIYLESNPSMIKIEQYLPSVLNKIIIKDSIIDVFPYFQIIINDVGGVFTEDNFYTEGLQFNFTLRDLVTKDEIKHNFMWSDFNLISSDDNQYLNGYVVLDMYSDFIKQDFVKSKSYRGTTSSIVRQIISKYNFPNQLKNNIDIGESSTYDIWYQANEMDFLFIKKLSKYSFSPIYKDSSFIYFIDMNGTFYFKTLHSFFNNRASETLYYGYQDDITSENYHFRNDVILTFNVMFEGIASNFNLYNKDIYTIDNSGEINVENVNLEDKFYKLGFNKKSIRKSDLNKLRSVDSFGIVDNINQENIYSGWINSLYSLNTFSYQINVTIRMNLKLCSGKIVELKFLSLNQERNNKSMEYSGDWLIVECTHIINEKGVGMTSMSLLKPSVNLFVKHKFYKDFI